MTDLIDRLTAAWAFLKRNWAIIVPPTVVVVTLLLAAVTATTTLRSCGCQGPISPLPTPISPPPTPTPTPVEVVSCDHVVPLTSGVLDGGVKPGDTVCIAAGTRGGLDLRNLHGTEAQPVLVVNYGGEVVIDDDGDTGIQVVACDYVHITGTGADDVEYGIHVVTASWIGIRTDESSHIEIDYVHVDGVPGIGILSKSVAGDQYGISIHDCKINDVSREGIYIGDSQYETNGHLVHGVSIYDCTLERIGWEGIQVCASLDVEVYGNTVVGAGFDVPASGQPGAAYIVDSYSSGEWYDNRAEGGQFGFYVHGKVLEAPDIHNNVIVEPAADGVTIYGGEGVQVTNNTIVEPGLAAVRSNTWMWADFGTIAGNLVAGAPAPFFIGPIAAGSNNWTGSVDDAQFTDDDYHVAADSPAAKFGAYGENVADESACVTTGDVALCSFALFWDPAWVTVAITDVYDMDTLTETTELMPPTYTLASEWKLVQGDALVATGTIENDLTPVVTTTMEFSATGQFDGAVPFIVPLTFGGTADLWVRARWVPEWCPTDRCPTVCTYVPGGVADADWWWFDELVGVMEPAGWTMYLPTVAKARE